MIERQGAPWELRRAYNVYQVPSLGVLYESDMYGYIKDMSAQVVYENGKLVWYPLDTSSYTFKSEPFTLDIRINRKRKIDEIY